MRKRLLSLLLCIVMCFSMLPGAVFAEAGEGGSAAGYTVTFDANGGQGSMADGVTDSDSEYKIPEECGFTHDIYTFDCWNTEKDGTGDTYYGNGTIYCEKDVTLYAQWILDLTDKQAFANDNYKW